MSKFKTLDKAKALLNTFFSVTALRCPYHIGGRACVTCDEMERCDATEYDRLEEDNVKLLVAGNSAMLSLRFFYKSDLEGFIMAKLFKSLEQGKDLPIIKPEEGFSLTFYTKYGQATPQEQQFAAITKVLDLLSANPWIETKMLINTWIKKTLEKLTHAIKQEVPKVELKIAPKVERSKIFERKSEGPIEETPPKGEEDTVKELTPTESQKTYELNIQSTPSAPPKMASASPTQEDSAQVISDPVISPPPKSSAPPVTKAETSPLESKLPIKKLESRKQPFLITAKEREYEMAIWPSYIKRKQSGDEEAPTIKIPSVTKAPKKVGPKKPTPAESQIAESHIPKEDQFELRMYEKKQAEVRPLPYLHTDDPLRVLSYLERLVRGDYEMRKMAEGFEKARDKIKQKVLHVDFFFEMGKVINLLRHAEPGLALNEHNKTDILKKLSTWKIALKNKLAKLEAK